MKFSLRQLQVFVAVARSGSVSRAADVVALSQSAASTALGELEKLDCVTEKPILMRVENLG